MITRLELIGELAVEAFKLSRQGASEKRINSVNGEIALLIEELISDSPITIDHFHWNPFRPIECIGGKVWFGTYYECRVEGKVTLQTPFQYYLKRRDGLVP